MSHFYGYLQGSRGEATRCGTKTSGINAHLRSWNNVVYASLEDNNGEDVLILDIPKNLNIIVNGNSKESYVVEILSKKLGISRTKLLKMIEDYLMADNI